MTKSANLYARIEPEVKEQAENILSALGIPTSNAINMFFDKELEKGYSNIREGRVRPADDVFSDVRKKYEI